MDEQLFEQLVRNLKRADVARNSGKQWTFGTKPRDWVRLLNIANGLIESRADDRGNVTTDARWSETLLKDVQALGETLRAIALGADAAALFHQESEQAGRPEQGMQQLNYAVAYWRARAAGLAAETSLHAAQAHFAEFEPPSKESLQRYARTYKERAFQLLAAEGLMSPSCASSQQHARSAESGKRI